MKIINFISGLATLGIGSCIDGNSVNITGGYMGCQCADHFRPGVKGCVCSGRDFEIL